MADYKVAIDAGHGGSDYGATYMGRAEKDDTLKLALAVGEILEDNGVDVFYVRTTDEYETPFKKATDANNADADYFVSIHRNSSETSNQYTGVETLVFSESSVATGMAANINSELEKAGFKNLGIESRPNLVVLKRTKMPAVLVEAGFINNDNDNMLFDNNFDAIANGIADGILMSLGKTMSASSTDSTANNGYTANIGSTANDGNTTNDSSSANNGNNQEDTAPSTCNCDEESEPMPLYRVQVGAFRNKDNADRMLNSLLVEGFPAFIIYEDDYYKVQVGAFRVLPNAIKMEQKLRRFRYNTYIVYS